MDVLPEVLNNWLLHYGGFALFGLLALGIIALPVPEETLLIFSGFLISQGTFSVVPTFISACLGSICGITGSYLIGLIGGLYVVHNYGSYVGLNQQKMDKAHNWFENYGRWVLFVGYFIPGVRHFTGVFAGISSMEYYHFALFAYCGAFFWVTTFLSVGYFFGNHYEAAFELMEGNMEIVISSVVLLMIIAIVFIQMRRSKFKNR